MANLSHINMIEYTEECGPHKIPKVVLYNKNKISPDQVIKKVAAEEYDENIVVMNKSQWIGVFKDGKEN